MRNTEAADYARQIYDLKITNEKLLNQFNELIKNLKIYFDPDFVQRSEWKADDPIQYEHDRAEYEIEALIGHRIKK